MRIGHVKVNGTIASRSSFCGERGNSTRGVNIHMLDPSTCRVWLLNHFDTHRKPEDSDRLNAYLTHRLTHGDVIIGVVYDEAMRLMNEEPKNTLLDQYGVNIHDLQYGGSFAFVAQKGFQSKAMLQKDNRGRFGNAHPANLFVATYTTGKHLVLRCRS